MTATIVYTEDGRIDDRDAILNPLLEYNRANAPDAQLREVGLLIKSAEGASVGGLWGRSAYEWLFVELLFVPQEMRGSGVGTALMRRAEEIARERGCTGVWLDTFAFQALRFYEKVGYSVFGELKDHPKGISQFWLQKRV